MSESTNHEGGSPCCPKCGSTNRAVLLANCGSDVKGDPHHWHGEPPPAPSHTEGGGETSKGPESCVTTDGTQVDLARFEGRQEPPAVTPGPVEQANVEEDESELRHRVIFVAEALSREARGLRLLAEALVEVAEESEEIRRQTQRASREGISE